MEALPGSNVLSGVAVRADGVPVAEAVVSLIAIGPEQQVSIAALATDVAGHFEIAVPASDELVDLAEASGHELTMQLSINTLVSEGTSAQSFAYSGNEIAHLVVWPAPHFVIDPPVSAYVLRPVSGSNLDLSPTTSVEVDLDGVYLSQTAPIKVGQFNVYGIGAVRTSGTLPRAPSAVNDDVNADVTGADATRDMPEGSCEADTPTYSYTPMHATEEEGSQAIDMDYTVVPYQRNGAHFRVDTAEETWQILLCGFGASWTKNGWRLLRQGMAITAWPEGDPSKFVRVGPGTWDTQNDDKLANGELSFEVDIGPVEVGVSIPTGSSGNLRGNAGLRGPQPTSLDKPSSSNNIWAWWDASWNRFVDPCCRGARTPQGIIVEGLYEFGQVSQPFAVAAMEPFGKMYCSSNKPCPLYN